MVNVVVVDRRGNACLRHYLEVYVNQHTGVETVSLGAGTVVVLFAKTRVWIYQRRLRCW